MSSAKSDRGRGPAHIVPFQPRRARPAEPPPSPNDLTVSQRAADGDDYHHRMRANLAAFLFTAALTAGGIWVAMALADLRGTQDCALSGRRDCARLTVPPRDGSTAYPPNIIAVSQPPQTVIPRH